MKSAARRVLVSGALVALGGGAALAATTVVASGQLSPPPTVPSVPSLPAPTLPAPTLPAPSLPPPPVAPFAPSTSPLPSPAPTPPAVVQVSEGLGSTNAGSAAAAQTSPARNATRPPSQDAGPALARRSTEIRGRSGRRGLAIPFALRRAGRVVVVVQGPLPSCKTVVRLSVRGRQGQNRLRFFGQVRGRTLEAGAYVIGIRPVRNTRPRWTGVQVAVDGARALGRAETAGAVAHCATASAAETSHLAWMDAIKTGDVASLGGSSEPAVQPRRTSGGVAPERSGVLPSIATKLASAPGELPLAVGIAALGLLALGGLGMIVFLLRFLRGGEA